VGVVGVVVIQRETRVVALQWHVSHP